MEECIKELVPIREVFVTKVKEVFEAVLAAGLVHLDGRLANFMCMLSDVNGRKSASNLLTRIVG